MNPRTIRWQAGVTFVLLVFLALAASPAAALWIGVPAIFWWLALDAAYAWSLGERGRSKRRVYGDRWVARFAAFGLLVPAAVAGVLVLVGYDPEPRVYDFTPTETAALLISAAALFVLVLSSSLVDWYYIRPQIDGVVCDPPCRSSGWVTWKVPTRWWFVHRGIATLAYMAFAFVVALVVMLMLVREHPEAAGVIGGVGGIAGILLIFAGDYRSQLRAVGRFALSPPYCLGDDLNYEAGKWGGRGFVLHVAVPVTKLVPLDEQGRPEGRPFVERKNSELNEADLSPRKTAACDEKCVKLNPECTVPCPKVDARRRFLVF